ncbi:MAG: adenosylcobinamide-phosphate synthase CbiB [Moorellales bacterium]
MGIIWLAFGLDALLGDPPWGHPVRLMGYAIVGLERAVRRVCRQPFALRLGGGVLVALVVGGSYLLPWWLLRAVGGRCSWLGWVLEAGLIAATVAARSLAEAVGEVRRRLQTGELTAAREALAGLVARDTQDLTRGEIVRAAVETVAENTVDGVTAPLFYALLGGAPLAVAYRAVNTLDSMLGYRSPQYRDLGWCAAKLDDLANFLPARFTGALICLAAALVGLPAGRAWRVMCRDARRHPSPNSGFPEAAVAGALGIRLGGVNSYGGVREFRPYLGEAEEPAEERHILAAIRLMRLTTVLALGLGSAVRFFGGP